jgi:hypothetical protein
MIDDLSSPNDFRYAAPRQEVVNLGRLLKVTFGALRKGREPRIRNCT